jgi:hypothetical protein
MSKRKWVYNNGKCVGAVSTTRHSDGSTTVTRQTARHDLFGNHAGKITSRTRY